MAGLNPNRGDQAQQSMKYLESLKFIQKMEQQDEISKALNSRSFDEFSKDPFGLKFIE